MGSYFLLVFLCFSCLMLAVQSKQINATTACKAIEREALTEFKEKLVDPSNLLSSWTGENCCRWKGISCSNQTGYVIKINLRNSARIPCGGLLETQNSSFIDNTYISCKPPKLPFVETSIGGQISSSLLDLKYLNYLDLSYNDFQTPIPQFLGSLEMLSYLDLKDANFIGMVPPHLGNLSNLRYLGLGGDYMSYSLWVSDMFWMSGLTSLEYLYMGGLNLSLATSHWLEALSFLPYLSEIHLRDCNLQKLPKSPPRALNFTHLSVIDFQFNVFNSLIPRWFSNFSSLVILHLTQNRIKGDITEFVGDLAKCCSNSLELLHLNEGMSGQLTNSLALHRKLRVLSLPGNSISGPIPTSIGNLTNLVLIDVSFNQMNGSIPTSIGNLTNLKTIDVSYNQLNGSIPESINTLANLEELLLFENNWQGILTQNHLHGLKKLARFSVSSTDKNLILSLSDDWLPLFSLESIEIRSCSLGPKFPAWVKTQKQLSTIILSDVGISDFLPDWFWSFSSGLSLCEFSSNKIKGTLPTSLPHFPYLDGLNLAGNLFSGSIPSNIGQTLSSVGVLNLSGNSLSGPIPYSIGEMKILDLLDLSKNKLSGEIDEDYWRNLELLSFLDLSLNRLSGSIPKSVFVLPYLHYLSLSGNNLFGDLSLFPVNNASRLSLLDLGGNQFSGKIPKWIGELQQLSELRLRDNMFSGNIPEELCSLESLHVLDAAFNDLSGQIPACMGNLTALFIVYPNYVPPPPSVTNIYITQMEIVQKGREMLYTNMLKLVNVLDLSNNNLIGEIPKEITKLSALGALNLSRNHLTGHIPKEIGALHLLETLDLSFNHLSGPIPPSMTSMTSLNHLNLSNNNLSGPIPSDNQFLTLNDPSIYNGNPELCGSPLETKCGQQQTGADGKDRNSLTNDHRHGDLIDNEKFGFFSSMGFGFIFGFWGVFGSLAIYRPWRITFFRHVDNLIVLILLSQVRLLGLKSGRKT